MSMGWFTRTVSCLGMPSFPAHRDVRDVIDRLIDHAALRHDRSDFVGKIVEPDQRVGLGDFGGMAGQERDLSRKAARPIERRPRRDDDESGVRDEHAASGPVVFVGKTPFDAAEESLAHLPAALGQQRAMRRARRSGRRRLRNRRVTESSRCSPGAAAAIAPESRA